MIESEKPLKRSTVHPMKSEKGIGMGAILKRMIRLRELEERRAQIEVNEAVQAVETHRRGLNELDARVEASHGGACTVEDFSRHHAFALRSEMQRRRQEHALAQAQVRTDETRARLLEVARSRQAIEEVNRAQLEREQDERRKRGQKVLDETGLGGWWRGKSS